MLCSSSLRRVGWAREKISKRRLDGKQLGDGKLQKRNNERREGDVVARGDASLMEAPFPPKQGAGGSDDAYDSRKHGEAVLERCAMG